MCTKLVHLDIDVQLGSPVYLVKQQIWIQKVQTKIQPFPQVLADADGS